MDVIKCADWVIDLGPEAGDRGGYLVYEGVPEGLTKVPESYTGRYLTEREKLAPKPAAEGTKPTEAPTSVSGKSGKRSGSTKKSGTGGNDSGAAKKSGVASAGAKSIPVNKGTASVSTESGPAKTGTVSVSNKSVPAKKSGAASAGRKSPAAEKPETGKGDPKPRTANVPGTESVTTEKSPTDKGGMRPDTTVKTAPGAAETTKRKE